MPGTDANSAVAGTRFCDVRRVGEVGSTNDEVMALAVSGAPEGVVVSAEHQTAGRGRRGRPWLAPPGSSLLVSVLLRPPLTPDLLPLTTLAAALAAAEACWAVAGFRPSLKWPNDLVVGSAHGAQHKLGGLLAEFRVDTASSRLRRESIDGDTGAGPGPVVVGLGLNVNWDAPPPEIAGVAVAAAQVARRPVDRDALLIAYLRDLDTQLGRLESPEGRLRLLDEYRRRCTTLGRPVRVELSRGTVEGRAVDVGPQGHLVVETGSEGQRTVKAGEVTHLDVDPAGGR